MRKPTPQHQLHKGTFRGRHVELMRDVRANLLTAGTEVSALRILSFGCSSGEECLDLADIFESAQIYGAEIDPEARAMAACLQGPNLQIIDSTEEDLLAAGPFDAIFAMNVLCLSPLTKGMINISEVYPFAIFDATVGLLNRCLRPGGFLTLYNAQYFLEATAVGSSYVPAAQHSYRGSGWIEKCSRDGDRVAETLFHWNGKNFNWKAWDRLLKKTPEARGHKHGRYTQVWIDPQCCLDGRLDVAIWRKTNQPDDSTPR